MLVPFGGAEHEWAAVEVGAWLARATGAALRLAGTASGEADRDASRLLATASLVVQHTAGVAAEPLLVEAGADGIITASEEASLVVSASRTAGARRASARRGWRSHSEPGRPCSSCGVGYARAVLRRGRA